MKTKKDNSLTIEVLTPLFIDTKQPFLNVSIPKNWTFYNPKIINKK